MGVVNLADIIRYESQSSLYLANSIFNKQSVTELKALLPDLRATFVRMVNDEASAHMIGSAMSGIGRSLRQRLLELAEQAFGPGMAQDRHLRIRHRLSGPLVDHAGFERCSC